jgi:hypothetical protein
LGSFTFYADVCEASSGVKLVNAFTYEFAVQRLAHLLGYEFAPALLINLRGNVGPTYVRDREALVLGHRVIERNNWRRCFDGLILFLRSSCAL